MLPSAIILALIFFFKSNKVVPGFNIPSSTREPKGTLCLDLLFWESFPDIKAIHFDEQSLFQNAVTPIAWRSRGSFLFSIFVFL